MMVTTIVSDISPPEALTLSFLSFFLSRLGAMVNITAHLLHHHHCHLNPQQYHYHGNNWGIEVGTTFKKRRKETKPSCQSNIFYSFFLSTHTWNGYHWSSPNRGCVTKRNVWNLCLVMVTTTMMMICANYLNTDMKIMMMTMTMMIMMVWLIVNNAAERAAGQLPPVLKATTTILHWYRPRSQSWWRWSWLLSVLIISMMMLITIVIWVGTYKWHHLVQ